MLFSPSLSLSYKIFLYSLYYSHIHNIQSDWRIKYLEKTDVLILLTIKIKIFQSKFSISVALLPVSTAQLNGFS